MNSERRAFEVQDLELRQAGDGQPATLHGYAVVFDSWSETLMDGRGRRFRERIAPTAFDRTLGSGTDIRALWNHNSDYPLGRTGNGSLRIFKDGVGLRFELAIPKTTWGADAAEAIRAGIVSGMSFGFSVPGDGGDTWAKPGADGIAERTLLDADLFEFSPVTFPAYPATRVGVRSVEVPDFADESSSRAAVENNDEAHEEQRALLLEARQRRARLVRLALVR